ncbi:MAG TPA: TetR/AcrR family transcriptional regulator [Bdellovibrionales bacterium]|nr:TetR/AcrR family transcriptional regulator [Bdellovibrionales bacterium]
MAAPKTDRRERIVQSALTCFVKAGVAQTRMADIAAHAKVDQPLIGYYFPTPESLYAEVVGRVLNDLKDDSIAGIERGGTDPKKIMTYYVRAPFEWGEKKPGYFSIWMYFYYLASYQPAFIELNKTIRQNGRDRIAFIIYSGIEKGAFSMPDGMTVAQAALAIQGIITGIGIMAGSEGPKVWKSFADEAVRTVLALLRAN